MPSATSWLASSGPAEGKRPVLRKVARIRLLSLSTLPWTARLLTWSGVAHTHRQHSPSNENRIPPNRPCMRATGCIYSAPLGIGKPEMQLTLFPGEMACQPAIYDYNPAAPANQHPSPPPDGKANRPGYACVDNGPIRDHTGFSATPRFLRQFPVFFFFV